MTIKSLTRAQDIQSAIRDLNDALNKISKYAIFSDSMACIRSVVSTELQSIENESKKWMTDRLMEKIAELEKEFANL
jgi:chromosomal replication initiation ATPase DnaA